MGNLVQSSKKNFVKIRTAEVNGGIAVPDAAYAYFSRRLNKHWGADAPAGAYRRIAATG